MSFKRWIAAAVLSTQLPATIIAKPADLPIDQRINYADNAESVPVGSPEEPICPASPRAVDAFERAERHRQQGQVGLARRGYQEVHLLAPMSRVGQQAIQRLRELENPGNDFSEEQEPPLNRTSLRPNIEPRREMNRAKPTMQEYLDMLRLTIPLGTSPSLPGPY